MVLIEAVLGNIADPEWAKRLDAATVDAFELDHWEAQKNRLRKKTRDGRELAVSLDRGSYMRDGDVLLWDESARQVVVARLSLRDVMVINLEALAAMPADLAMRTGVELGHALGNQHWPALVKGSRVYVPLTVDHKVMSSVMKTHDFEGISFEFLPGSEIVPYLAPHESRRLFGGAEGPVHSHTHEQYVAVDAETGSAYGRPPVRGKLHAHENGTVHEHPHEHGHEHAHAHGDEHPHPPADAGKQ